ncbi:MAG: GntR family transcriptional regulator [Asticcacaulis sp.]
MSKDTHKVIPIREQIADQLRSDIVSGTLAPQTKLTEETLASRFGVSRGPIRDVLLELTKEGLLVAKVNKGVYVNTILDPNIQDLMVHVRREIETFAVNELKDKITKDDVVAMKAILDTLKDAFRRKAYTEVTKADIEFHRYLIFKAGGQELVNIWQPMVLRMRMNYTRITDAKVSLDEHLEILNALASHDGDKAVAALLNNIR